MIFPKDNFELAKPEDVGIKSEAVKAAVARLVEFTLDQGADQTMIIRDGKLIWAGRDIDNVHPIWSCSKSYTSMCLGLMLDDGLLALDDPIAKYAPFLEELYPDMTIRQCAAFTAGYQQAAGEQGAFTVNPFYPAKPIFEHGTHFHYSMTTDLISYAITSVCGKSLHDLFYERVGSVIGIDKSAFLWGDWSEFALVNGARVNCGSGMYGRGVWTSARQIARVGLLACNYGNWDGRQLISREYFEQATTPQSTPQTPPHNPEGWYLRLPGSYGINWWLNGQTADGKLQWPNTPTDTFALQGNNNNICMVIPSWRMVLVRLGTDGIVSTDPYDDVLKMLGDGMID